MRRRAVGVAVAVGVGVGRCSPWAFGAEWGVARMIDGRRGLGFGEVFLGELGHEVRFATAAVRRDAAIAIEARVEAVHGRVVRESCEGQRADTAVDLVVVEVQTAVAEKVESEDSAGLCVGEGVGDVVGEEGGNCSVGLLAVVVVVVEADADGAGDAGPVAFLLGRLGGEGQVAAGGGTGRLRECVDWAASRCTGAMPALGNTFKVEVGGVGAHEWRLLLGRRRRGLGRRVGMLRLLSRGLCRPLPASGDALLVS